MNPLVFEPYLRPMVWGGRRLETRFAKPLPGIGTFGESWELSAHPHHLSRVADGQWKGTTLTDLMSERISDLFGDHLPINQRFPLLIKLLDCHQLLSIQVHPSDALAPRLANEPLGKTEAWIILAVEPGGRVYAGLKDGVTRAQLERHLAEGTLEECLHAIEPQPGDCIFLPAGTVHAVGGGVVMAEVQQSSDATFRLYDWNRPGPDGLPRTLHIEQSLEAINWQAGPVMPAIGVERDAPGRPQRMVECEYFIMDRYTPERAFEPTHDDEMSIWLVLDGEAELKSNGFARPFKAGETVLIPAASEQPRWTPLTDRPTLLGVRLPHG